MNRKKFNSKCLTIDSSNISDPLLNVNHFNDHFFNISKTLVNCFLSCNAHYNDYLPSATPNSIFILPTCPLKIPNILKVIKCNLMPHLIKFRQKS